MTPRLNASQSEPRAVLANIAHQHAAIHHDGHRSIARDASIAGDEPELGACDERDDQAAERDVPIVLGGLWQARARLTASRGREVSRVEVPGVTAVPIPRP